MKRTATLLLLLLKSNAKDGKIRFTHASFSDHSGIPVRSVGQALKELKEAGKIRLVKKGGSKGRYGGGEGVLSTWELL